MNIPGAQASRRNMAIAALIVVILSGLVYANCLRGDFVCDDIPQIVNNEKIKSVEYLPSYFTKGVWASTELEYADKFFYRPLLMVSYLVDYKLWGMSPVGFHITNLLLHIGNALFLFFLIRIIIGRHHVFLPWAGAAIFAVHPVHVESVSWISGRTDLMMSFFFLCALLLLLKYREKGRSSLLILSVISYALSLLSKEVAVTFPLVLLAYDYLIEKRVHLKQVGIYFLLALAYLLVRNIVLGRTLGILHYSAHGLQELGLFTLAYMKLLIVPWPLNFYFTIPQGGVIGIYGAVLSIIVLIAAVIYAAKNRPASFPLLVFAITLLPPLLLAFKSDPAFAIRYLYLPSAGFVVLVAVILAKLTGKHMRVAALISILIIAAFGALTVKANADWKNDEAFYSKAIATTPGYWGGYFGLAKYYERTGQDEKALRAYENSENFALDNNSKAITYRGIAKIMAERGDADKSIGYYKKALALEPASSDTLVGMGNIQLFKKDYEMALKYYSEAFEIDGKNYAAAYNLALIYNMLGDRERAEYYHDIFIKIAPKGRYPEVDRALGVTDK